MTEKGTRVLVVAVATVAVAALVAYAVWQARPRAVAKPVAAAGMPVAPHPLPGALAPDAAIERLVEATRADPANAEAWIALGRALAAAGRFKESAQAFGEAIRFRPGNADLLADRADVLAMAQGRRFEGEPDRLVAEALAADPHHAKALALAGTAAFERGAYPVAAGHWRRLLQAAPAGSEMARQVQARLAEAERMSAGNASR